MVASTRDVVLQVAQYACSDWLMSQSSTKIWFLCTCFLTVSFNILVLLQSRLVCCLDNLTAEHNPLLSNRKAWGISEKSWYGLKMGEWSGMWRQACSHSKMMNSSGKLLNCVLTFQICVKLGMSSLWLIYSFSHCKITFIILKSGSYFYKWKL